MGVEDGGWPDSQPSTLRRKAGNLTTLLRRLGCNPFLSRGVARARRAEVADERALERNSERIDSEGEAEDVDLCSITASCLLFTTARRSLTKRHSLAMPRIYWSQASSRTAMRGGASLRKAQTEHLSQKNCLGKDRARSRRASRTTRSIFARRMDHKSSGSLQTGLYTRTGNR